MGEKQSKLETLAMPSSPSVAGDQPAPKVSASSGAAELDAQPNGVGVVVSSHEEKPDGAASKLELFVEKAISVMSTVVLDSNGGSHVSNTRVEESDVQEVRISVVPAENGKVEGDDKASSGRVADESAAVRKSPDPKSPSFEAGYASTKEDGAGGQKVEEDGVKEGESNSLEEEFFPGNFVWGKIKSHPWWPGQVYEPSNASESARRLQRRNRHLVAYFGDGTFAWCDLFQMKPFQEEFAKLSSQSSSNSFVYALEKALEEFGRCVETEMTCFCRDARPKLVKPYTINAGIREGVTVPDGRVGNYSVSAFEPANLVSELRDFAVGVPVSNALGLTVLKSQLSAFYFAKGYGDLPEYYDPAPEGISDGEENGSVPEKAEVDVQIDNLKYCPAEVELKVTEDSNAKAAADGLLLKRPDVTEDKLHQRKKQRSMAELMAENVVHEAAADQQDSSSKPKKKKPNLHVSPPLGSEGNETGKLASPRFKKHTKENQQETPMIVEEEKPSKDESEDGEAEEGLILSSPRPRKKSKYLSPPYTMLGVRSANVRANGEGTQEEATTPKGGSDSKVVDQLNGAPSETSKDTEPQEKVLTSSSPRTPKEKKKGVVVAVETEGHNDMAAGKLLLDLNVAAVNPMLMKASDSSDSIKAFFEKFRNSSYRGGSQIKKCNGKQSGKKTSDASRKFNSRTQENGLPRNASGKTGKAARKGVASGDHSIQMKKSGGGSGPKKRKPKDGTSAESPRRKSKDASLEKAGSLLGYHARGGLNGEKNRKEATQEGQAALLLTFLPGSSHPSREDLFKVFGKFGELKEAETEVMKDSDCAQVVFMKASDGERVFDEFDRSLFGHSIVSYRLRYLSSESRVSSAEAKSQPAGGGNSGNPPSGALQSSPVSATVRPPLLSIKEDLEKMMSTLTEPGSVELVNPEVRTNLVGEISGLLKKVTRLVDSTS